MCLNKIKMRVATCMVVTLKEAQMTSYDITRRVGKHWNGVKISRL